MRTTNPLFARAERGTLDAHHLVRYLANVRVLVLHTPLHLERAIDRATSLAKTELACHFKKKVGEEQGHDKWAERDVATVRAMIAQAVEGGRATTLDRIISFIEATIDEDPELYLSYILFAEHLIVLMGPTWLDHLETRCGIPRSAMTVIGNHAELDREHSEEGLEAIDALVRDPRKLPPMRRVLSDTVALFERFSAEVVALGDEARYAASVRTSAA
ncbi:MAG: hypothetical protein JNK04_12475 [Myxococcales bacterium]|nr:hypothetical protein [Myxococcales bacterium]